MHKSYTWKTACIFKETNDAITISFDIGNDAFKFKPGQFINLTLLLDDVPITRSYSFCNGPDKDEKPAITVKEVNGGLISNYIFNNAAQINYWNVTGPHRSFLSNFRITGRKKYCIDWKGQWHNTIILDSKIFSKTHRCKNYVN